MPSDKEMINNLIDNYTNLQRIIKSDDSEKELEDQIKILKAKLEFFGIITSDLEFIVKEPMGMPFTHKNPPYGKSHTGDFLKGEDKYLTLSLVQSILLSPSRTNTNGGFVLFGW